MVQINKMEHDSDESDLLYVVVFILIIKSRAKRGQTYIYFDSVKSTLQYIILYRSRI